jgi:hypothetical protein
MSDQRTMPQTVMSVRFAQLNAMQDAAAVLLEHDRHISPDVITVLCQIR